MKKTFVMILALATVAAIRPLMADTETVNGITWSYTVENGEACIGSDDTNSPYAISTNTVGSVSIPTTLGGYPVTKIGDKAFYNCKQLTGILIPNGIKEIRNHAFYQCSKVQGLVLPSSVEYVGKYAICYCTDLRTITLMNCVCRLDSGFCQGCSNLIDVEFLDGTIVSELGSSAFAYCSKLTKINIPSGVKSIKSFSFVDCSDLEEVVFGPDMEYVLEEGDTTSFRNCNNLSKFSISSSNLHLTVIDGSLYNIDGTELLLFPKKATSFSAGRGVLKICGSAFANCPLLRSVVIPDTVQDLGSYAFYNCPMLTDVSIEQGSITNISISAFANCSALKNVSFPKSLKAIDSSAFSNCALLKDIVLPEGVLSVGAKAFYGCSSVTNVYLPNSLTFLGSAFEQCGSIVSATLPNCWINSRGSGGLSLLFPSSYRNIKNVRLFDGATQIGYGAFANCSAIEEIEIPLTVTIIDGGAFYNCTSLKQSTIPYGVEMIGWRAFSKCTKLTKINIPDSVKHIREEAFSSCNDSIYDKTSVSGIILVDGWAIGTSAPLCADFTSERIRGIADNAFASQTTLRNLVISSNTKTVGSYSFQNCTSLTNIVISEGTKYVLDRAFEGCRSLMSVSLPASIIELGFGTFNKCTSLQNITIPENDQYSFTDGFLSTKDHTAIIAAVASSKNMIVPNGVTNIAECAFYGNTNLESITLPDSLKSIGSSAFYGCTSLTSIIIPENVERIGSQAFGGCSNLAYAKLPLEFKDADYMLFYNCPKLTELTVGRLIEQGNHMNRISDVIGDMGGSNVAVINVVIREGVTSIGDSAFFYCKKLQHVEIPNTVTNIAMNAFLECSSLHAIDIPASVENIERGAFAGCSALVSINVDNNNDHYASFDGVLYDKEINTLVRFPGGKEFATLPQTVKYFADVAFEKCARLTEIDIPIGVESIGDGCFENCSELRYVSLPETITNVGTYAFCYCKKLERADVAGNFDEVPYGMFYDAEGLKEIILPASVRNIAGEAFGNCYSLESVAMGNNVTNVGFAAFRYCKALRTIVFSSSLESLRGDAICYCTSLSKVTMPYGVKFDNSAWTQTKPDSLSVEICHGATSFDVGCFANTKTTTYQAVQFRELITTLELPSSVTNIQMAAINQLVNLTKIIFHGQSFYAISDDNLKYLRSMGLEIEYVKDDSSEPGGDPGSETGGETSGGNTSGGSSSSDALSELNERLGVSSSLAIISYGVRKEDPTILDIVYIATNKHPYVDVRVLAFQDGVRSFANVIRPETFVEDTAINVGNGVSANSANKISWRISADWQVDLAKAKFEVMQLDDYVLPLKLLTIPAINGKPKVQFSTNPITAAKVLDALLWEYAAPGTSLTLSNGVLKNGNTILATGANPTTEGAQYVIRAMGFDILSGETLDYVNNISRLGLAPNGIRQYATRDIEE